MKRDVEKSIFESNVRDYQGNNSVNSSIAETLSSDSKEDFWWLNNGVTILASEVTFVTNRSLQLVNPENCKWTTNFKRSLQLFWWKSRKTEY